MTSATAQSLRQYIDEYMAKWPFSGTILVARQGEIYLREAYGEAVIEHGVPNRTDMKFGIWSITKSFTALAIVLLAEEGKLGLDDPISRYVPEMEAMPPITIRQAMNHVSGLPNLTDSKAYNQKLNKLPLTRNEAFSLILDLPMAFPAGTQFAYNNTGYYLLGLVIEAASGMTYKEWLSLKIWQPLALSNTGIIDGTELIPSLASAYHITQNGQIPAEYVDRGILFSTGGMYSTIDDLYAWALSFESGKLLSRERLEHYFEESGSVYGLGWFIGEKYGRKRIHHGGAYRGFRSELHRFPDDQVTVIVLTNYDYVPATKLADALSGLVLGEEMIVPELPPPYPVTREQLASYTGVYEGFGCKAIVDLDRDGLFFEWNNREIHRIYPVAEDRFHDNRILWEYVFRQDDAGELLFMGMKRE